MVRSNCSVEMLHEGAAHKSHWAWTPPPKPLALCSHGLYEQPWSLQERCLKSSFFGKPETTLKERKKKDIRLMKTWKSTHVLNGSLMLSGWFNPLLWNWVADTWLEGVTVMDGVRQENVLSEVFWARFATPSFICSTSIRWPPTVC